MAVALACHNLSKIYGRGPQAESALCDVSLSFESETSYLLLGPSGSGKTTLLSILGCLLAPSEGEVEINGRNVNFSSLSELTRLRRQLMGFVFQHSQLLPFLSVQENLSIVADNAGMQREASRTRLASLLERLGISSYARRKPGELSGGQRQRVAIARAILHHPRIVLADEPTAALDWENGQIAVSLLIEQAKAERAMLLTVTHDTRLIDLFDCVIRLDSGRVQPP
jgi:putative ABC transport system ATP-binding protein